MTETEDEALTQLKDDAYAAIDQGLLTEASTHFAALLQRRPDSLNYPYMRGLAHKYLRDWPTALHHSQHAGELADDDDQAVFWNGAIAATALGRWDEARRLWSKSGVRLVEGSGPIEDDFGIAVVRLNPWQGGETVFVRRIDPARARLLNVPLPESGHRFGDIVLHDGAPTGSRFDGDRQVSVFNELQRLEPSQFQTFVAFVSCPGPADMEALRDATLPCIGMVEDWTGSIVHYCLRCSYGAAHRHPQDSEQTWQADRNLGIAAQSRLSVQKLLDAWAAAAPDRYVEAIENREVTVSDPEEGAVWWRSPEEDEGGESDHA